MHNVGVHDVGMHVVGVRSLRMSGVGVQGMSVPRFGRAQNKRSFSGKKIIIYAYFRKKKGIPSYNEQMSLNYFIQI
jgi:hypothetical protein